MTYGYVHRTPPEVACPALLTPLDEAVVFAESVTFTWGPIAGVDAWAFYLYIPSDDSEGDIEPVAIVTGTSYEVSDLESGVEYAWTVSPYINGRVALECPERLFTVELEPTCCEIALAVWLDDGSTITTEVSDDFEANDIDFTFTVGVIPRPGIPSGTFYATTDFVDLPCVSRTNEAFEPSS